MRRWRVTTAGRVVIAIFVACVLAGILAPRPYDGVGLFVAMLIFLGAITDGWHALPVRGSDDERVAVFRRMYKPRGRG